MNKTQRYDILIFYEFLNVLETQRNIKRLEQILKNKKARQNLEFYD